MKATRPNEEIHTAGQSALTAATVVRRSVRQLDTLIEKLVYLGGARNGNGLYTDPLLAFDFDPAELDGELRRQHSKIFAAWLQLRLEEQHAEVLRYFSDQPNPSAIYRQWVTNRVYERLVPFDAYAVERNLFLSDLEIVTTLVSSDLIESSSFSLCRADDADASPDCVPSVVLNPAGERELRDLLHKVLAKEHLASLWERGKAKVERYAEEINRMRKAGAVPDIQPPELGPRTMQH